MAVTIIILQSCSVTTTVTSLCVKKKCNCMGYLQRPASSTHVVCIWVAGVGSGYAGFPHRKHVADISSPRTLAGISTSKTQPNSEETTFRSPTTGRAHFLQHQQRAVMPATIVTSQLFALLTPGNSECHVSVPGCHSL